MQESRAEATYTALYNMSGDLSEAYRSNERRTNGAEATNDATNEYNDNETTDEATDEDETTNGATNDVHVKQRERHRRTRHGRRQTTNDATNDISKTKQPETAMHRTTRHAPNTSMTTLLLYHKLLLQL